MTAGAEALLVELGLPPYQARVLLALLASSGPATSQELAERCGVPRTSIYLTVGRLIDQGLAVAVPATQDQPRVARWHAPSWADVASTLRVNARARYEADLVRIGRLEALGLVGAR